MKRIFTAIRFLAVRIPVLLVCVAPFMLGLGSLLCGEYEAAQGTLVPRYLWNDEELIRKHLYTMSPGLEFLADRYGASDFEDFEAMRSAPNLFTAMSRHIAENSLDARGGMPATRDLNDYKNSLPAGTLIVVDKVAREQFPRFLKKKYFTMAEELLDRLKGSTELPDWMYEMYPDDSARSAVLDSLGSLAIAMMNRDLRASYRRYEEVPIPDGGDMREPRWLPLNTMEEQVWGDFVRGLPGQYKWMPTIEVRWRGFLRERYSRIAELNSEWGTSYSCFSAVAVPDRENPATGGAAAAWSDFVLKVWPRSRMSLPEGYDDEWRAYLKKRLQDDDGMLAMLLREPNMNAAEELKLPRQRPSDPGMDVLWCDFVETGAVPAAEIKLMLHRDMFGPFLRSNYLAGSIISLNEEWHTDFEKFSDVPLPLSLSDLSIFGISSEELRRQYKWDAWRRAVASLRYPVGIVGRTLAYAGGAALVSLFFAAVAAYLLARLPMRYGQRVAVWCAAAALLPAVCVMQVYGVTVTEALDERGPMLAAMSGISLLSVLMLRAWFLDIIKKYREMAAMDGVSEWGFILRMAVRYSWPAIIYAGVIHFVCFYCAVDWQLLSMGRLWSWTLGVWCVDHASAEPSVRAAAAFLSMLPVFFVVALAYPVLSRYCLIPVERKRTL